MGHMLDILFIIYFTHIWENIFELFLNRFMTGNNLGKSPNEMTLFY